MSERLDRIMARVVEDDDCWVWTGSTTNGYGKVSAPGNTTARVHRVVYEELRAVVPGGLDLDHLCRNRACCNPDHLEPVTRRTNLMRGQTIPSAYAARTHCSRGHAYDEDNTRIDHRGARVCKACRRIYKERERSTQTAAPTQ